MKKSNKLTGGSATIRSLIISILVIFFFVGIVLMYYRMLYAEKRNSIIKDGQTAASQSAAQFEKYISTNIDAIKLSAYSLDEMIIEKKSDEEIQAFLVGQSTAIRNAVIENMSGFYGYINGKFFSGTLWEPPEDYVPTERPWYKNPMTKMGEITILDPYVDMQSGNTMIAMGKSLCDANSVISVDISLAQIQKLTEMAVESGNADMEMILNDEGLVVAHSDREENGKDYSSEKGTLGAEIYKRLEATNDDYFDFNYKGSQYVVYAAEMLDGWQCVSVKDATRVYGSLNFILLGTIIIVIFMVLIIGFIMGDSHRRSMIAERLSSQLSSTADIYISLHEIDFLNDTYSEILNNKDEAVTIIGKSGENAQQTIRAVMEQFSDPSSREALMDFVDFSKINERMKDINTITMEFLSAHKQWRKARYIVSERLPGGRVSRGMYLIEDIDEEKKRRDRLIDMSQRAIAASEAKSAFLSNMSHEIRTPINAVLGMNEMILRECDDEKIISYSESVSAAGHTLLGIINDILDFSRIESGKMHIIPVDYDLSSMLNELVDMIKSRVEEKGLVFITDFDKNAPRYLHGDEIRIKQIITNLLTNAVKYTQKGSVSFSVSCRDGEEDKDEVILDFAVKDTGIGIKKEDIEKLFLEFERVDETKNRNVEGTGLGISITESLLKMMGSTLQVKSEYGLGSLFYFSLKQPVVSREPIGDREASEDTLENKQIRYRVSFKAPEAEVLVVDDNPMNLTVIKNLLKQTEIRIDTAESGKEALKLISDKKYDVVMLDHMMPEMDGVETLKEIKKIEDGLNKDTPFICLTANAISGARDYYISEGFNDYLTKPVDSAMLEMLLLKYLPEDIVETEEAGESGEAEPYIEHDIPKELEAMRGMDCIDIEEGINNNGSPEAYLEMLDIFNSSIDDRAKEIDEFYEEGDIRNYTIKVHALKSSARIIGAMELGKDAELLENAGKSEDTAYINEHHEEFIEKYRGFGKLLAPFFISEAEEEKPVADPAVMEEAYKEVKEAAEEMDCDRLQTIFDELKAYRVPDKDKEIWDKIKDAADNYNYSLILDVFALEGK